MSRSYKKNLYSKDNQRYCHRDKHRAWRKIRRKNNKYSLDKLPDGNWYKKITDSWDIHDYVWWESSLEVLKKEWWSKDTWWQTYYK